MGASDNKLDIDYIELAVQINQARAKDIYSAIVNEPFKNKVAMARLFLGFICIFIVDEKDNAIWLKGVSDTEEYRLAVKQFEFKPTSYRLDFNKNKDNTIVQTIIQAKPQRTLDWAALNRGQTPTDTVRLNQASSGIASTMLYPLSSVVRGALMYNYYQYPEKIGPLQQTFMEDYTKLVSACLAEHKISPIEW